MKDFPHHYVVTASAMVDGEVGLRSEALPPLRSTPPIEFGGPGNLWSPETLLVGAVSDCFILTFRAVARASNLAWTSIECETRGTLDRVDRTTQFTRFDVHARLTVPAETDHERAHAVLEKAERGCLITSSLKGETHLTVDIDVARPADQLIEV
jgi:organic hydroperoxide reductase OsmC/OhrA